MEEITKSNELIKEIVKEEWEQFQLINSQGERSSCQDDWTQFNIMRTSQFMAWPEELLQSYYRDLAAAKLAGQNLIFNKYAYMMERTDPANFEIVKQVLPEIALDRKLVIEKVVDIQVRWAEEFAEKFPKFAGSGRAIHEYDERPGETSVETYQRGEIYSYGSKTQFLYCNFIFSLEEEKRNLTYIIRENMAKMYGYASVEDAERSL